MPLRTVDDVENEQARAAERVERAKEFLLSRKRAYQRVFNAETTEGFTVMQDLAWAAHAHRSTFDPDPIKAAYLQGKRDLWLRIQHHLSLDETQLLALYSDVFVKGGFGR